MRDNVLITSFDLFPLISLTVAQNEDIVEQFLKENASAGSINSPTRQKSVV